METLDRPAARTRPRVRLELLGFGLVVAGYVAMTLGILEIGGVFNVVLGLAVAWLGCVTMFAGESAGPLGRGRVPPSARRAVTTANGQENGQRNGQGKGQGRAKERAKEREGAMRWPS
jgi:hypothetical protein